MRKFAFYDKWWRRLNMIQRNIILKRLQIFPVLYQILRIIWDNVENENLMQFLKKWKIYVKELSRSFFKRSFENIVKGKQKVLNYFFEEPPQPFLLKWNILFPTILDILLLFGNIWLEFWYLRNCSICLS